MSTLKRLYRGATLAGAPMLAPAFLCSKRGRGRLPERFGSWRVPPGSYTWLHGASMGEVRGLLPLMRRIKEAAPEQKMLLTATSITGIEAGKSLAHATALLPFDHPLWIRRALDGIKIQQLLITETELWPCLIEEMARQAIPVTLLNARLSKYSYPRYQRYFGSLLGELLPMITRILCSDSTSARRFVTLGAREEQVQVVGNTKYDSSPTVKTVEERGQLREMFFDDNAPVFCIGSIRPGEEKVLFPPLAALHGAGSSLNVIVAPRHTEKFEYFAAQLAAHRILFRRWSERDKWDRSSKQTRVVLLDGLGMLEKAYSFSDLAFIGATLVDIGGHNPFEAAAYGTAIATGPYVSNIEELTDTLQERDGMIVVKDQHDMREMLETLVSSPELLRSMGFRAKEVWAAHQGTVERVYRIVF